jgi:hypothetical protein
MSKKSQQKKNMNIERKEINGKPNPKYVDLLDEDKPIAGQKFVCVSFISPEEILKKKEVYMFERFLKTWDFNKFVEKNVQFLNFISFKYNLSFDALAEDHKEFINSERESLANSDIYSDFKTFMDHNEEELEKQFSIEHNFQTSTRGFKIRGSYPTLEEAKLRAEMLRENDNTHCVYVGQVGYWMPFHPPAEKTGDVQYKEEELNELMHKKKENEMNAKNAFDQRVKETKEKAISENIKNAEKSGNTLTQTIDENGNLIGVTGEEEITTADLRKQLFEGENIVTGDSDHGQSQLISGPFAASHVHDDMEEVD